ncbi:MAG: hypothetical protein LLF95_08040 [Bacteroidales bacterium]|nr:hypothetical protein [Bacteroidales bacterium]
MKFLKIILLALSVISLNINVYSQDNNAMPERTPEQEAAKQTEKLQQELNLSAEQIQQVQEINLKYARARKTSNSRSDALKRIKNKDADLQKVLNPEQYKQLQNKRYERSSFQSPTTDRDFPANSSGFKPESNNKTHQPNRQATPSAERRDYNTSSSGNDSRRTQQSTYQREDLQRKPSTTTRTPNTRSQQGSPSTRSLDSQPSTSRTPDGINSSPRPSSNQGTNRSSGSTENSSSRNPSGSSDSKRR